VTDGRSYLRSTSQQFDVVQDDSRGYLGFDRGGRVRASENNLYTVEAFREYFQHLKPEGNDCHHTLGIPPAAARPCAW